MAFFEDLRNRITPLTLDPETQDKFWTLEGVGEVPDDYAVEFDAYFSGLEGSKARAEFLIRIYAEDDPDEAIREFFNKRR